MEFFKDEPRLKCRECRHIVINPKIDLGCAEWCQYAAQCLGTTVKNLTSLRSELIYEMKAVFGQDKKRIEHALAVLDYVEQIQAIEGGDPLIVKAAGILHDIGIHQAEQKHGSSSGKYQEIEGPPIAEEILKRHEIEIEAMTHILKIIANHHSAKNIDTLEFKILWDADLLVNLQEETPAMSHGQWTKRINKTFKTTKGRQLAFQIFTPMCSLKTDYQDLCQESDQEEKGE